MEGEMIRWKNTGNKSWSDENHPRRYSDDFPCLISVMYVYVHMYGKAMGAGGPPSERAKATSAGWHWWCHPRLHAAPTDPTEGENVAPVSCSHLTAWKGTTSQCTSIFLILASYNLKNSNFYFSFKRKSWYSSTKNRALIIIYSKTINPIILEIFFPSNILF